VFFGGGCGGMVVGCGGGVWGVVVWKWGEGSDGIAVWCFWLVERGMCFGKGTDC